MITTTPVSHHEYQALCAEVAVRLDPFDVEQIKKIAHERGYEAASDYRRGAIAWQTLRTLGTHDLRVWLR